MIAQDSLKCPCCLINFGFENTPKILKNCQHTICVNCLKDRNKCPLDQSNIGLNIFGIKNYLTNTDILQLVLNDKKESKSQLIKARYGNFQFQQNCYNKKNDGNFQFQQNCYNKKNDGNFQFQQNCYNRKYDCPPFCLKHTQKAQIYCQQQNQFICKICVNQLNHQISCDIGYKQIIANLTNISNESYKLYEQINLLQNNINQKSLRTLFQSELIKKRQIQGRKIKLFIHQITDLLKKTQIHLNKKLDQKVNNIKQSFNFQSIKSLNFKTNKWKKDIHKLTTTIQNLYNYTYIPEALLYLNQNSLQQKQIIKEGNNIIQKMQTNHEEFLNLFNDMNLKLQVKYNPNPKKLLESLFYIDQLAVQLSNDQKSKSIKKTNKPLQTLNQTQKILPYSKQPTLLKSLIRQNVIAEVNINKQVFKQNKPTKIRLQKKWDKLMLDNPNEKTITYNFDVFDINTHQITFQENSLHESYSRQNYFTPILKKQDDSITLLEQSDLMCEINSSLLEKDTTVKCEKAEIHLKELKSQNLDQKLIFEQFIGQEQSVLTQKNKRKPLKCLMNKSLNIKPKKTIIPQKYYQIWQQAKLDKKQIIDLTGAQLGDNTILQLCEYLNKSQKAKALKLIRNKITDQIVYDIFKSIQNSKITSINLSQNNLTQKSLQILEKMNLGNIKSITLSLNKISLRKVKDQILSFKQKGITLSI